MSTTDTGTTEFIYRPRGMGMNWLPCFICGHNRLGRAQADMAAFVDPELAQVFESMDAVSHPIMELFNECRVHAKLDYRKSEPHHLQVKLGACGEHEPNLMLLFELTHQLGKITPTKLKACIPGRKLP